MRTIIFYRRSRKQKVWTRDSIVSEEEAYRHLKRLINANPGVEFRYVDVFGKSYQVKRALEVA